MPISKLLPDGRVEIYNSNTGEVKSVMPEELPQYNPKLVGQYQEMVQSQQSKQQQEQASLQLAESGNLPESAFDSLAKANPELALKITQQGRKKAPSKEQQKQAEKFSDVSKSIDILEKNYGQLEAKGRGKGDIAMLMANLTGGAQYGETADYEALRKSMIGPLARTISGEVGVLTDKDISRAEGLLPKVSDDPKLAQRKMDNLREMIAEKGGPKVPKKKEQSVPQQTRNQVSQPQGNFMDSPIVKGLTKVGEVEHNVGKAAIDLIFPRTKQYAQKLAKGDVKQTMQDQLLKGISPIAPAFAGSDNARLQASAGVELGSLAAPLSKLGLVKGGALGGGAYGATSPKNLTPQERISETLTGAGLGALTGSVMKVPGATKNLVVGKASQAADKISKVFKVPAGALDDFRTNTGLDFADEVIKRDLPKIKGKSNEQILDYYTSKTKEMSGAADKFLDNADVPVAKSEIINVIDNQIKKLGGVDRLGQSPAIQALQSKRDEILAKPDKLTGKMVNQFKRDIQGAAGAAVGGGESTSVVSNAYDDLQKSLNKFLEGKAPGIKDTNKSIQFYRLAKDAMQKRVDQTAKQEGRSLLGKVLQASIPTGAGGMAAVATGNPLFALLGAGIGAGAVGANEISKSPEFRTRAASAALKPLPQMPEILQKLLLLQGPKLGQ